VLFALVTVVERRDGRRRLRDSDDDGLTRNYFHGHAVAKSFIRCLPRTSARRLQILLSSRTEVTEHSTILICRCVLVGEQCLKLSDIARNTKQWSRDERLKDLVDVVARDGVVERAVEIVQQLDDLYRTTATQRYITQRNATVSDYSQTPTP